MEIQSIVENQKRSFVEDQNQTNPPPNLLNLKKQELKNLENKLQEKQLPTEPNNNSKLILGIGMGILGLGLIGLVVWLILRRKNNA